MRWGPAGYERRESGAIPAASGTLALATVFGAVEKRLAETYLPPLDAVTPNVRRVDYFSLMNASPLLAFIGITS